MMGEINTLCEKSIRDLQIVGMIVLRDVVEGVHAVDVIKSVHVVKL